MYDPNGHPSCHISHHPKHNGDFMKPPLSSDQIARRTRADAAYYLSPEDLRSKACRADFLQRHDDHASIDLSLLLNYPDDERFEIIQFLATCPRCIYLGPNGKHLPAHDPYDAVLQLIDPLNHNHSAVTYERIRRAVVEAAVVFKGSGYEAALRDAAQLLRRFGVPNAGIRALTQQARQLQQSLLASSHSTVLEVLPDAPVGPDARVPPGWGLSKDGIYEAHHAGKVLIPDPVVITGRICQDDGRIDWQLAFRCGPKWQYRTIGRGDAQNVRTAVNLASFGFPIKSTNAADVVNYLGAYETANREQIPQARQLSHQGWVRRRNRFLLGNWLHSPQGSVRTIEPNSMPGQQWPRRAYYIHGDEGQQQLLRAFRKRGNYRKWNELMARVEPFDRVRLGVYAALSAPLVRLFRASNFVFEFCSPTSQGKTTSLMIAASLYGCPDLRDPNSLLGTWDSTRTHVNGSRIVQRWAVTVGRPNSAALLAIPGLNCEARL